MSELGSTGFEDPGLLAGEARYVADLTLPRMLHAAFVRSPVPHAEIRSIDTSAAAALAGVKVVFTGENITARPLADPVMIDTLKKTPQSVIAKDRVRFVGEAVAVVVAVDAYVAEDAAALVEVDYNELGVSTTVEAARADGAAQLFDDVASNTVFDDTKTFGDPTTAFANAERVYKRTLRGNRFVAAPMETRGVLADYERADEKLTVWSSTQMPDLLRMSIATSLRFSCTELARHRTPRRRRLWPEDGFFPGRDRHPLPGAQARTASALDRGPAREPDRSPARQGTGD